jgi:pimeloyl-ACP methyl ester carboxylesterase
MSLSAAFFRPKFFFRRSGLSACAAALLLILGQAEAQQNVQTEVLEAEGDGFPIHISYYPALEEKNPGGLENAPVIILLHGENGSRLVWDKSSAPQGGKAFAEVLNDIGYAVVTVDLRKHGESVVEGQTKALDNTDYTKMARGDLPAVKLFLVKEHEAGKLNVNKLGIVASDVMAPVALEYAELDWRQQPYLDGPGGSPGTPRGQDVRAIALLSPVASSGRVNGTKALNYLKNPDMGIGFFLVAGTRDAADKNQTSKMHEVLINIRQNEERVTFLQPNTNARGTDLLNNPAAKIEPPMLEFFKRFVKDANSEWRTRKSRYDRDTTSQ